MKKFLIFIAVAALAVCIYSTSLYYPAPLATPAFIVLVVSLMALGEVVREEGETDE